jgi:hypothetical protein
MAYSLSTSVKKGSIPIILALAVRAGIAAADSHGIKLDEATVFTVATALYGAAIGAINYLKNRSKKTV